ncbi:MAG: hypothetical protein MSG64_06465 [Pyrinomonadaceae bacterium MAG19_C2-C3]|nr:hypothetical protein [Pyrinomonadaceae bacterium MAG19_C2-C3]
MEFAILIAVVILLIISAVLFALGVRYVVKREDQKAKEDMAKLIKLSDPAHHHYDSLRDNIR